MSNIHHVFIKLSNSNNDNWSAKLRFENYGLMIRLCNSIKELYTDTELSVIDAFTVQLDHPKLHPISDYVIPNIIQRTINEQLNSNTINIVYE